MKIHPILSVPVLAMMLSACSGTEEGSPEAGQYQQTVTITDLSFPGMTDEQKKASISQMEEAANSQENGQFCIDQTDHGAQWKEAASQMASAMGGQCETVKDAGSATRLDLKLQCKGTEQGNVEIVMTGASHTQGYESTMSFLMSDPASDQTASLAMTSSGKRTGDCPN